MTLHDLVAAAASGSSTEEDLRAFILAASKNPAEVRQILDASPWSAASIMRLHALRIPSPFGLALAMALIHTRSEAVLDSIADPGTFEELLLADETANKVFSTIDRMGQLARFRPCVREHVNRAFQCMVEDLPNYWKGTVDVSSHAKFLARSLSSLPPVLLQEGLESVEEAANRSYQQGGLRVWAKTEARWMRDYTLKELRSFATSPEKPPAVR